jgi:hypothetical protein
MSDHRVIRESVLIGVLSDPMNGCANTARIGNVLAIQRGKNGLQDHIQVNWSLLLGGGCIDKLSILPPIGGDIHWEIVD